MDREEAAVLAKIVKLLGSVPDEPRQKIIGAVLAFCGYDEPIPISSNGSSEQRRRALSAQRQQHWRDRQRELGGGTYKRQQDLLRDTELCRQVRYRDDDRCRYCGVAVDWADRRGQFGATYDHVDPAGDNSLSNVVVACLHCNCVKTNRTPQQAGMSLLPETNPDQLHDQPPDQPGHQLHDQPGTNPDINPKTNPDQPVTGGDQPGTNPDINPKTNPDQLVTGGGKGGVYLPGFSRFWSSYPKRVGKGAASTSWKKQNCEELQEVVLAGLKKQEAYLAREGGRFIPLATTWLNQRRWEDDPPKPSLLSPKTAGNLEAGRIFIEHMRGLNDAPRLEEKRAP